jgi:hypothetical protein
MKGALVAKPALVPRQPGKVLELRPMGRKRWAKVGLLFLVWGSLVIRGFALRVEAQGESAIAGDEKRIVRTHSGAYCSVVAEGQEAYRDWLGRGGPRALEKVFRQYGGEVLKPGELLEWQEDAGGLALVRLAASRTLCYVPKEALAGGY